MPSSDLQDHPDVHVPPPLLYAVPLAIGLLIDWKLRPLPLLERPAARAIGETLIALAVLLALWCLTSFIRHRTSPIPNRPASVLIVDGPFRWTRNPAYLAAAIIYIGIAIAANTLWPFFFFPFVLVSVDMLVISREEAYLGRKFGEEYREYRGRVRRWL